MQPEALLMWTLAVIAACAFLRSLRRDVLVPISDLQREGTPMPEDDVEQQPETDCAQVRPRRFPSLQLTVAAAAAVRLGLLVALHR